MAHARDRRSTKGLVSGVIDAGLTLSPPRSGYDGDMRILATHVSISCIVVVCGLLSGYGFASDKPAIGTCFAVLCLALVCGSAVMIYDAFKHSRAELEVWSVRWGAEVGVAPRLLRTLLLSIEAGLGVRPCRGDTMEERTERIVETLHKKRWASRVAHYAAEKLH